MAEIIDFQSKKPKEKPVYSYEWDVHMLDGKIVRVRGLALGLGPSFVAVAEAGGDAAFVVPMDKINYAVKLDGSRQQVHFDPDGIPLENE